MSATALASALGMSSSVIISRMLRDVSGEKKQRELINLLRSKGGLFNSAEVEKLNESIAVSRLGKRAYKTQKSIEMLLFGSDRPCEPLVTDDGIPLSDVFSQFNEKEPLQIVCVNCIENDVMPILESLFSDPHRVIEMSHYVCINEDTRNPALVLSAAGNMLFDKRYRLYLNTIDENGTDAYFFTPCVIIVRQGANRFGEEFVFLVMASGKVKIIKNISKASIISHLRSWLTEMEPAPKLLTGAYNPTKDSGILNIIFTLYKLEKRRAVYQIKPDLSMGTFPFEVVKTAFLSGPNLSTDEKEQLISQLKPIVEARIKNMLEKTQNSYFICSPSETEKFLSTGVLSDHPIVMRPFTKQEICSVVDMIFERKRINANYHFHFLRDDRTIRGLRFIGYEGLGVMAMRRDTNYIIGQNNDNLFIDKPLFLEQYIDFYKNTLLPHYTYTEEESLHMLNEMRNKL